MLPLHVGILLVVLSGAGRAQSLLAEITTSGIEFRDGVKVELPAPALTGKLSPEQTEQAKQQLAGNDGWEKFSRDSVVAPITIKLEYVTDKEGIRVGHNVHSAFIVHTKLDSLADKDLMQQIFGKPESSESSGIKIVELSDAELKAAGVIVNQNAANQNQGNQNPDSKVTFSQVEFTLLEKIRLSGVMRIERTSTPSSTTICWLLDPQFKDSEKLRGTWLKLSDSGSEPKPYSGWGGYLSVSRVSESPEALLIESRMLLHELPEWFSASNFVRSKLPLAIQEGARNFRRKLK